MQYTLTAPCNECPFLNKFKKGFTVRQLEGYASGEFGCHKTCELNEDDEEDSGAFEPRDGTVHCAGALIYLEKRERPHQMMRIAERLRMYDRTKLDMDSDVR